MNRLKRWSRAAAMSLASLMGAAMALAQTTPGGGGNATSSTTTTTTEVWYGHWWVWAVGVAVFLIVVIALTNRGGRSSV